MRLYTFRFEIFDLKYECKVGFDILVVEVTVCSIQRNCGCGSNLGQWVIVLVCSFQFTEPFFLEIIL